MSRWVFRAEGFLSEGFVTLTGGAFLTGLAVVLGAGPVALALLAALPFLAQVGQMLAPWLERRLDGRRRFVVPLTTLSRLLWLVPVALLAFNVRGEIAVTIAVAAVFAHALLGMIGQNGWLAWVADLVPPAEQADLFGQRAWAATFATLVTSPLGAFLLDAAREQGYEDQGLAVILAAGTVLGVVGALSLTRLPDVRPATRSPEPLHRTWRRLLTNTEYRTVLGLFGLWSFAIGVSAPFWTLYMLRYLGFSFVQVILHGCIALIVRLLCNAAWTRVLARVGSRRVLIACGALIATNPIWWLVSTEETTWPVWAEAFVSGVTWTGFNQAAFIQPIAVLDSADRSRGLAMFHVVTGALLFLASLLSGVVLEAADSAASAFLLVFAATGVLRASTAALALRLTEPGVRLHTFFIEFVGTGVLRRPAGRVGAAVLPEPSDPPEIPSKEG